MDIMELHEDFCTAAPEHDHAGDTRASLERLDIVHELQRKVIFILPYLDVRTREAAYIVLVKDPCPGLQRLEFFAHSLQTRSLDHPSMQGCFIGILGKDVPASENQILKVSERYKLLNKRRIVVWPFAQTNGPILRDGTYGPAQPFFDQFHTGNQCGANRSHTGEKYSQLPLGGRYRHLRLFHG
jgi:hypothetical protein